MSAKEVVKQSTELALPSQQVDLYYQSNVCVTCWHAFDSHAELVGHFHENADHLYGKQKWAQEVNSFIKRLGLPSDTDLDTISLDSLSEAEALTLNIMRIKAAHMKTIAISLS
eukprot:m.56665 g.56665  ORF g.56665 m.56665 type:complete len:113 (-) comp11566_c0_seq9:144-482(-)